MIILDVMSWQHFTQLDYIRKLPLDEQVKRYNYYLMEQQSLQLQMIAEQHAGSSSNGGSHEPTPTPSVTPSISITPSITPSISITPTVTPSVTPTPSGV